jgi:hypothetical protein
MSLLSQGDGLLRVLGILMKLSLVRQARANINKMYSQSWQQAKMAKDDSNGQRHRQLLLDGWIKLNGRASSRDNGGG